MEFVDKIRTMPLGRQILLALGIFAILGFVIGSIYFVFLRQPDSVLFSNLKPLDAATIVADLDKRKVPYHLADSGSTILMAADKVDATRLSILSEDLPLKGTVGFELFNKSDIGLTEFEQRINYQRALQGELSRTIMALDDVDTARVHLSLPEPTVFRDDQRAPKASIALTLKPGRQLSPAAVQGIQRIVAAAVPDLNVDNVVVVDGEGDVVSNDLPLQASAAEAPDQNAVENYYAAKVRQALTETYPGQTFTVTVIAAAASPQDAAAPAANGQLITEDVFSEWTPDQRKFPLKVAIATSASRDAETEKSIRVAAAAAIGDNPNLGDDITITSSELAPASAPDAGLATGLAATRSVASAQSVAGLAPGSGKLPWYAFWIGIIVVALVGLTVSGGRLLRLARSPRRLTEAERQAFASRFEALLQPEGDVTDGL